MWPNEQINGISFCGALMNGGNHVFFSTEAGRGLGGRGVQTHAAQTVRLDASNDLYINNGGACYYDYY